MKENLTPLRSVWCILLCKYVQVCVCNRWTGRCVCHIYRSTQLHLSLAAREVAFLFPYFFIHFFPPNISPRLPSSHPNQRTHRPLLGTPCPGNPPCTARYLRNTKDERLSSVIWWQLTLAKQWQGKTWILKVLDFSIRSAKGVILGLKNKQTKQNSKDKTISWL